MGYMRHHAIIVTGSYEWIEKAYKKAKEILGRTGHISMNILSPLSEECTNDNRSFAIFPDGSKEGWKASDKGDEFRNEFIDWLAQYEWCEWVEVQYGDDGHETKICRDSDHLER